MALLDMVLMQLVFAVIGARALFVLLELREYAAEPGTVLDVWRGGLSFHGGLAGALIATILFARWRHVRFAVLADICTPALAIGYAVTRIGCFMNGCCYGCPTNSIFGIVMPETGHPMPLHPTQLYASAGSIVIFFILRWAWPRMHRPGMLFPFYVVLYSVLRYLCEITRIDWSAERSTLIPALSVAQVACIVLGILALGVLLYMRRMPYENPTGAMAVESAPNGEDAGDR